MAEHITQLAYARHRGVSAVAVHKAIKAKRISLVNGLIDPVQADIDWARNTHAGQRMAKVARALAAGSAPPALGPPSSMDDAVQVPSSALRSGGLLDTGTVDYGRQRAIREGYLARLAKIDYEVRTGRLIDSDKTRLKAFSLARKAREMLLGIPDRLAPILAGEVDAFEVHRLLTEEVRRVCDEIAHSRSV